MVVDERSRRQLYRRLEEVLGSEAATTLFEHLPPVGWADVARRHDLVALEQRIELRFARVYERFNAIDDRIKAATSDLRATLERELRSQTTSFGHELPSPATTMVFGLVSVVLIMAALVFALVRFS